MNPQNLFADFRLIAFVARLGLVLLTCLGVTKADTTLMPSAKEVSSAGASYHINVTSDTDWSAETDASWVTISPDSASGDAELIVNVEPNPTASRRTTTITIDNQTHTLVQRASPIVATNSLASSVSAQAAAAVIAYGNTFSMDQTFSTTLGLIDDYRIYAVTSLSDGRFYAGGVFSGINGKVQSNLGRFNSDGTVDTSFNPGTGLNADVNALAVQTDGRLLVGGSFTAFNGTSRNCIVRLNTDGTLDTTFNPGTGFSGGAVYVLAVQSDGRILVAGLFTSFNGTARNGIVRLNADGTLDTAFNPGSGFDANVNALAVQADGRMVVVGGFSSFNNTSRNGIARLNTDGSLDTNFAPGTGFTGGAVYAVTLQSDGLIIAGGNFTGYNGTPRNGIARLNATGTLDATYNLGTGFAGGAVYSMLLQADGRIVAGGNFTGFNGASISCIARLNTDSSLDSTFNPGTGFAGSETLGSRPNGVYATAVQTDGRLVVGGLYTNFNGSTRHGLVRLTHAGALDSTATEILGVPGYAYTSREVGTKILVAGAFTWINNVPRRCIAQLNADGTLDTTFNPGTGFTGVRCTLSFRNDGVVTAFAVQPDGYIIVGGYFSDFNGTARNGIARLNADGTLDTTFNPGTGFTGGQVYAVALQTDGRVVDAGK